MSTALNRKDMSVKVYVCTNIKHN